MPNTDAHDDGRFHAEDATRMTERDAAAAVPYSDRPVPEATVAAFLGAAPVPALRTADNRR